MIRHIFIALLIFPLVCFAQAGPSYKSVTLDGIYAEWDEITKTYNPGMSVMQPQKIRFTAKHIAAPQPCSNAALEQIFNTLGRPGILKQVAITQCIKIVSDGGRTVTAWVQDVLVPGLNSDVKIDGQIELYADLLAYGVGSDRARNMPFMVVARFEPK